MSTDGQTCGLIAKRKRIFDFFHKNNTNAVNGYNQKQVIEQVNLATEAINKNKKLLPAFLKHIKLRR